MKFSTLLIAVLFSIGVSRAFGDDSKKPAVGLTKRVPWNTSRIVGSPEPPAPYRVDRVFSKLKFKQPVDITNLPGSDRLFVVEVKGQLYSFPNRPTGDVKPDLFFDLAKQIKGVTQVYGLAFHPQFQKNRYCYISYVLKSGLKDGSRVSRFTVNDTEPPTVDPKSEKILITWLSGGHNGAALKFGPDGYLYISTGDGSGPNPPDTHRTGQDISDLLSSILRIDVDRTQNGKNYRVPDDNPFVKMKDARPEVWSYGFRNPWKMSFDKKRGDLWVGDVGWELWELLYRVQKGGNYGWSVVEGRQSTNPEWKRGPTPVLPPTVDHPHSEAASITGGYAYYGKRLPKLFGAYVYGDYETGKIWGLRFDGKKVTRHEELVDTTLRIVCFTEDNAGELYLMDYNGGTIHQLSPNPAVGTPSKFPRKLSETGLFASVKNHVPAAGVIPYSLNAEPWADHAVAERFVALPGKSRIKIDGKKWTYPKGAVLAKTLSLPRERGNSQSLRRLETQVLYFDGVDWRGYTYRWNDQQTDASLLDAVGADHAFEVINPSAPGGREKQTWHFSSRAECHRCHNPWSGPVLGFDLPQLNKEHNYGGTIAPQLETLAHIDILDKPILKQKKRTAFTDPRDQTADRGLRARAYLHVNCSHCHRLHAGSAVLSKMTYDMKLDKTDMLGVRPTQGTFEIHAARVIAPGDPYRSVLWYRMSKLGRGRMPHIGSRVVDAEGVTLIHDWIKHLPKTGIKVQTGDRTASRLRTEEADLLKRLQTEKSPGPTVDQLLASTSGAMMVLRAIETRTVPGGIEGLIVKKGTVHTNVAVRELFERFLPEEQRIKRLGSVIQPEQILTLSGNADRGKTLFFKTAGMQCRNCHQINRVGKEVGPDLSKIGKKLDRPKLLESMLTPSKSVDPKFVTYLVETTRGRLHTGLLVKKTASEVVLKDNQNKLIRIPAKQIEQLVPQRKSLMPELLLRDMTAQQVADLLAYLSSLK